MLQVGRRSYWKQLAPAEKLEVCLHASGMTEQELVDCLGISLRLYGQLKRNMAKLSAPADRILYGIYTMFPDSLNTIPKSKDGIIAGDLVRRRVRTYRKLIRESEDKFESQVEMMALANRIACEMYARIRSDERLLKGAVSVKISTIYGQLPATYSISYILSGVRDTEAVLRVNEKEVTVHCIGGRGMTPIMKRRTYPLTDTGVARAITVAKFFILYTLGLKRKY